MGTQSTPTAADQAAPNRFANVFLSSLPTATLDAFGYSTSATTTGPTAMSMLSVTLETLPSRSPFHSAERLSTPTTLTSHTLAFSSGLNRISTDAPPAN